MNVYYLSKREVSCLCMLILLPIVFSGCATGQLQKKKIEHIDLNTITEEHPSIVSPNGRYVLYTSILRDDSIEYIVYLKNLFTGTIKSILMYERYASAQWSPDSKHLLINWGVGSNESTSLIYKIGNPTSGPFGYEKLSGNAKLPSDPIDISALLHEHEKEFCFANSGKLFIYGVWHGNKRIELDIEGRENEECYPEGFHFLLDYVLGKGFENLRQVKPREN